MSDHEMVPPDADAPETPPAPETQAPAPAPRGPARLLIAGGALLALGLWLVIALLPGVLSPPPERGAAPPPEPAPAARRIQATLFYVSDDGSELVPVVREVPFGDTPADQARHIVAAQLRPPADGLVSAIPAGTSVRGLFLSPRGEAYVDLSPEAASGHTGGSLDEALAVFAIVNAVTANLPDVTAVQILIDGKEVDSLAGHIDLRHPIRRGGAWIRKGPQ